jgi:hypothetical protein
VRAVPTRQSYSKRFCPPYTPEAVGERNVP